ncbi:MAG: OadG family transporter subunit [Kiritimatiellae bacterium]|nr:OadG family transporter subunit [Kiritimatiellia bacterium]
MILLVAGMGTVYAFLYLLVLIMRAIAVVVPRFNYLMPDTGVVPARPAPAAARPADDGAALAVAVAAAAARKGR